MRVLVFGTRDYCDRSEVEEYVRSLPAGTIVISGMGPGVDRWAAIAAEACGLAVELYPVKPEEWNAFGPAAGPMRNSKMAATLPDLARGFWDGTSRGTRDMSNKAIKTGCPVEVLSRVAIKAHGNLHRFNGKRALGSRLVRIGERSNWTSEAAAVGRGR